MMLAGIPVPPDAAAALASLVRAAGADDFADRLDGALADDVSLLALTIDERAIILDALEEPPDGLAELRVSSFVRLADHAQGETCASPAAAAVDDDWPTPELRVRADLPAPGNQAADLRPQARCVRGAGRVDDLDRASGAGSNVHLERRVVVPGHDRRERHLCDGAVRITRLS